jgi:hypothetical protein
MRLRAAALAVLAGSFLTFAPPSAGATAGSYQVSACNLTPEAVNNSWTWVMNDPSQPSHYAEHANCPYRIGGTGGTADQEGACPQRMDLASQTVRSGAPAPAGPSRRRPGQPSPASPTNAISGISSMDSTIGPRRFGPTGQLCLGRPVWILSKTGRPAPSAGRRDKVVDRASLRASPHTSSQLESSA